MQQSGRCQGRSAQRRYAPKTKSGCLTCKIRRVKCDEAKPHCKRCTSTGRTCDGYSPQNTLIQKNDNPPGPLRLALTVDVSCDRLEQRTFDFFRARTAPCVSGYFQDSLWDQMILQISHSEPAVRHAINALGAQHEESVLRRKSSPNCSSSIVSDFRTSFPLKQYSKALTELQTLINADDVSMDLLLICSLLFVHFEALRESFTSALVHAESAIRILHANKVRSAKVIDSRLVQAMMRIDIQGAMYLGMRVPGLPYYDTHTDLPSAFQNITEARDTINIWTCRLYHFMRTESDDHKFREPGGIFLDTIAKAHQMEQTFIKLDSLLWDFMHQPNTRLNMRESHGLNMLRCRAKIDRILSACCLYTEASTYDRYLDTFEEILILCNAIMNSDNADRRLFSVSLDEGLLHPLWFTATHCRESRIRHQALRLMRKLPAQRGIWHVEALTSAAQVCIEYEEEGCGKESPSCEDIPEWRRVHSSGFNGRHMNTPEKKAMAIQIRVRPNGMDGEWTEIEKSVECWGGSFDGNVDDLYKTSSFLRPKEPRVVTWP